MASTKLVSYSELDTLRQCRLKHRLGYVERWKPESESETLSRGKLFHAVMEQHYRLIKMHQDHGPGVIETEEYMDGKFRMRSMVADPETAAQTPQQELVEWMYRGYTEYYGHDERWKIVAVEHPFEVWLPTPRGTRSSFRLKGKIDLVVRDLDMGGLWIVDHKSCKDLPKGREYDLDDQFALYDWGMRHRGNDIRGIIHNAVRTTRLKTREMEPNERFKRTPTVRTQEELDTIAVEAYEQYREAYRGLVANPDFVEAQRVGDEAVLAVTPPWVTEGVTSPPRSPNTDLCRWRCPFTEPCLAGRKGADMRGMLSDSGYVQDFQRH